MANSMSSREVIQKLRANGWELETIRGDHYHFVHQEKPGKVTVPHPVKDMILPVIKSIERQSGIKLR